MRRETGGARGGPRRPPITSINGQDSDNILRCGRNRRSSGINMRPGSNLWHAPKLAEAIGYPFTHFVTANLQNAGCPAERASERFRHQVIEPFRKWVTRPGVSAGRAFAPATFAWVLENTAIVGVHVHWAVHIPAGAEAAFLAALKAWLQTACGGTLHETDLDVREVDHKSGLARYMLKGGLPLVADFFKAAHEPQGTIVGKRSGTSLNVRASVKRDLRAVGLYPHAPRRFAPARPVSPHVQPHHAA